MFEHLYKLLSYGTKFDTRSRKRRQGNVIQHRSVERLEDRRMLSADGTLVPEDFQNSFDDILAVAESVPAVESSGISLGSGQVSLPLTHTSVVDAYITLTKDDGVWDPHETIYDTTDAPVLSASVLPSEDYLFYEKATFERVYAGTVPEASEIVDGILKDKIGYSVAQDEYETLFFNLYSRQTLTGVTVGFSDFTNGSTVLDDAEIKIVKNWWQAGLDFTKTAIPHFVPELLLSDDVSGDAGILSDPDAIAAEGWDALDLPSFANLEDASTDLLASTSKQFAIIVNAPEGTPAGTYTSTVSLKDSGGVVLKTLDLTLEVLPFQLRDPERDYLVFQRALIEGEVTSNLDVVSLERYTSQVEDIAKHGINGLLVYGSTLPADVTDFLTTKIDIIKSNGIDGKVAVNTLTQEAFDLLTADGSEAYAYGRDEPNNNDRIVLQINESDDIHDLGGKVVTSINLDWADRLDDINDPIYSLPGLDTVDLQDGTGTIQAEPLDYANILLANAKDYIDDLANGIGTLDRDASYYWQSLQELPAVNRSLTGFYLWNTGFDGVFPYAYQHIDGNPYDDFDVWIVPNGSLRDALTTYPSQEGPVSTIQWEAFREGIDDVRYLQTWTYYHTQVLSLDAGAAASSQATIDAMLNKYKDRDSLDGITPETFAADRATLQNEITSMITSISLATGDFDLDQDTDGFDFLVWQRNTSIGNLADWEANFGAVSSPLATTEALVVADSDLASTQALSGVATPASTLSSVATPTSALSSVATPTPDEYIATEHFVSSVDSPSIAVEMLLEQVPQELEDQALSGLGSRHDTIVNVATAYWQSLGSNLLGNSTKPTFARAASHAAEHDSTTAGLNQQTPWEDIEFSVLSSRAGMDQLIVMVADHQIHHNQLLSHTAQAFDKAFLSLLAEEEWNWLAG